MALGFPNHPRTATTTLHQVQQTPPLRHVAHSRRWHHDCSNQQRPRRHIPMLLPNNAMPSSKNKRIRIRKTREDNSNLRSLSQQQHKVVQSKDPARSLQRQLQKYVQWGNQRLQPVK
eukprot:PhF_6_TR12307/c1_g1_i1/m.19550